MVKTLLMTSNIKFNQTHKFVRQGHTFDLHNFLKSAIRFHLNCLSRHLVISKRVPSKQEKNLKEAEDNGWWWVQKMVLERNTHSYTHFATEKSECCGEKLWKHENFPLYIFNKLTRFEHVWVAVIKSLEATIKIFFALIELNKLLIDTGCKSIVTSQHVFQR